MAYRISATTIPLSDLLNALVFLLYRRDMKTGYGRLVRRLVDVVARRRVNPEDDSETIQAMAMGRDLFLSSQPVEKLATDSKS